MMGTGPLSGRRIAVINWRDLDHTLAGGSEVYAWQLATGLVEAGARVDFITARDAGQRRTDRVDGVDIHRGGGAFTFYAHAWLRLLRGRRQWDAVIDPSCGIPAFSPLVVARRTPVVLVMHHVHQAQFATYFSAPLAHFGQWLERVAMPRVYRRQTTVAVSDSTRAEMRSQLGWRGAIGLLANGAPLPDLEVAPGEKDPRRVVVLGRLVPHKRVDAVVEAVALLAADHPDLHLDIVGKGPEEARLAALVTRHGLEDRVTLHGFVEEDRKAELLRQAAVHVCASDVEGWGQVVIEAAGHGVPTIARNVSGLRDSVRDQETGWLVPDRGLRDLPAALATQLRTAFAVIDEPEAHLLMIKRCRHHAADFSWTSMRRQAVALIGDLVHHTTAVPPHPTASDALIERVS